MTILISASRAAALFAASAENSPFVTGANLADGATLTTATGTEGADGAAANAATGATYDFWAATPSTGDAVWHADLGAASGVSFVGIAAHSISEVSATVRVEYSIDNSVWTDCGAGPDTPSGNEAIGFRFAPISARYWRVRISGATDDVAIGVIWLGQEIIIPRRLYQGYAPPITPTNVVTEANDSEGGHLLGSRVIRRGSSASCRIDYVEPSFIRGATWKAFQSHFNDMNGTFWAWRPGKYGDLFYGRQAGGATLVPENSGPRDLMGFEMRLRLYHDE